MTPADLRDLSRALLSHEQGATMMEYAVVLTMVAIGAVAAFAAFGAHLADFWAPFSTAF
jgi:Flp pilus assembly pilin Flp